MGFPVEQAKKALTKTKNESLTAAIDSIVQSQLEEKKPEPKKFKLISYECPTCTLINIEDKSFCEACGTPAPESAKLEVKDESELKREAEERLRLKQELEA